MSHIACKSSIISTIYCLVIWNSFDFLIYSLFQITGLDYAEAESLCKETESFIKSITQGDPLCMLSVS